MILGLPEMKNIRFMKALFIHDHPFIKNKATGEIYTSGNLNSTLWERYLKHFDTVTVIGRCKIEEDVSRYHLAEKDRVKFNLFTDVTGGVDYFKKKKVIDLRLEKEIKQHDVIILRFPAVISMFAADFCIKNDIAYVAEIVGCVWDANWNYGGLLPKLIAPYSYFKMKKVVKYAMAAIYVTEHFLQKRYPTKGRIVAHASNVIIRDVQDESLSTRLQKIRDKPHNGIVNIGVIGNIAVRYKGYDVLLNALSSLPIELLARIKVTFVGGGNPAYLQKLIKEHGCEEQSEIIGKLKAGGEIFDYLDNLDLYVHPSKQEGLPRVVIEAMSRATPVLASSVAGIPELIRHEFLHEPGDVKKLGRDLVKIIQSPELQLRIAVENFEKSKDYLFPILEERREAFFREVKATLIK